ncbi:MAG: LOG family protein [Bacteroidota bacterium]|nr:LOG family protein [Bacteroidota bacterium]MDP4232932.1 LOG family protein [Bacteroidota bacterium]MDP4241976.1 LOG family protein [Bacteroidota bacterium]MDP4286879.1 LOG family protein [Bacteroidota bacterium]
MKKLVAVFGPASCIEGDALYTEAQELGRMLAEANFSVVTGGYEGVMEAASRGAHDVGGTAIGVTAEVYYARGREANPYLTREIRVKSANDRTMELLDLPDAFIAIGNSTGTLVEVALAWDYMVKRFLPEKPLILLGTSWHNFIDCLSKGSDFQRTIRVVHPVHFVHEAAEYLREFFGPSAQLPSLDVINV